MLIVQIHLLNELNKKVIVLICHNTSITYDQCYDVMLYCVTTYYSYKLLQYYSYNEETHCLT